MAADEEGEEAEQVEQERDHGLGLWPDRSRWINHLPGGRGFGEGQPENYDRAFSEMSRARAAALTVLPSNSFFDERRRLVDLAAKNRLPAVYPWRDFVVAGGLMSYGANVTDLVRRAAAYVDRILKGAKPSDLPVQQPQKFELIINLKTAKVLGLTIPQSVLARADQVISSGPSPIRCRSFRSGGRRGSLNLGEERFRAALRHQRAMYLKQAARGEELRVVYGDYPTVRETLRYPTGRKASERRAPSSGPMTCSPHH